MKKDYLFQCAWLESARDVLAWFTYPFFMAGSIGLYFWGLGRGISLEVWVVTVTIVNFVAILVAEQVLPRNARMNYLRDKQALNDIGHGMMQGAIRPIVQSAIIVLFAALSEIRITEYAAFWPTNWPFIAQFIVALLIGSFMDYVVHRSFHTFDWMWWFHAIHHDTPQMHIMKSARVHVGEEIINSVTKPFPLILLGAPTEIIVFLGMWTVFDGNIAHANIHQRFPAWFHYVLGTVQLHNLHHASDRTYQDSNYSGAVPLWDIVFGTFNHPDRATLNEMGIENNPVPRGFIGQVLFPFKAQMRTPHSADSD